MAIDPTQSGGATPPGSVRVDQTGGNQSARQSGQVQAVGASEGRDAAAQGDQVLLSSEAREASQAEGATSPAGLSKERLREVLQRLTSGYYDTPQVLDRIARKVAGDLGGPTA